MGIFSIRRTIAILFEEFNPEDANLETFRKEYGDDIVDVRLDVASITRSGVETECPVLLITFDGIGFLTFTKIKIAFENAGNLLVEDRTQKDVYWCLEP